MSELVLPTSLVGSYAQPEWLIDKSRLGQRLPTRVILHELWRLSEKNLVEAQNDATVIALNDQHRAGVDIVTDGEMRRESYSNRFANALTGIDLENPGEALDRAGKTVSVPRVTGEITRPEAAREYALAAIDQALLGASGPTVLHVCFGYGKHVADKPDGYAFLDELDGCLADEISIECAQPRSKMNLVQGLPSKKVHVGVIDLRDINIETPEIVAARIESALEFLPEDRLVVAPDCGMKYLSREVAYGKLSNMVKGRDLVLGRSGGINNRQTI